MEVNRGNPHYVTIMTGGVAGIPQLQLMFEFLRFGRITRTRNNFDYAYASLSPTAIRDTLAWYRGVPYHAYRQTCITVD